MESVDLRFFEVVAETKNLTRAAQVLNTVQSNVTGRIKRLEDELGTELLHRHSRGVSLTAAGESLLPFAIKVRQVMEDAASSFGAKSTKVRGALRIGAPDPVAAVRLPPILLRFAELFPEVEVTLRTGVSSELREQVLDHKLDGAFVSGSAGHEDLHGTEMWTEELMLVGARGFRGVDSVSEMDQVKVLVFRSGCTYRSYLETLIANLGIHSIKQIELGTLEGILGCVSADLGITLLPRKLIEQSSYRTRVSMHQLKGQSSVLPTLFVRRANSYVSSAMSHFIATSAEYYANARSLKYTNKNRRAAKAS